MSRNVNCGSGVAFLSSNARNLVLSALFVIFGISMFAQNAVVGSGFSSGWGGGGCPTGNGNFNYLSASVGSSYILTTTANGTGNQYWRYGVDWGGTTAHLTITPGSDVLVAPNVTYNLNTTCTTSGSMYYNVPSTSYNYIFKSKDAGSAPTGQVVFFEVQGAVQSVSSVSQSPAAGSVNPSAPVTVTANLSGSLSTGQAVYLRYTNDGYATSTVVQMSGSGTTYTAAIPTSLNGQNKTVSYYVFTSGTANVAGNGSNADLYTINLNNNGGTNYSYTITNSPIVVTATGGTVGPTGYATLAAAVTAINAGTHTGAITVSVCGATTESTASIVLNASGSGAASYTSISVKPAGGAQTLTAATTAGNPFIDLSGADNVTIDGVNAGGLSLTISNTTASGTSGTSTIRFIGGATNNILTNCTILGSFSAAVTTNGGNIFFSTDAVTTNGNDNNTISNCNIGPAGANLNTKGIYMNGSTTTTALGNSGNTFTNNNIYDYFGAAVSSAGIYMSTGNTDNNVTNNRFYQTASRTQTTGTQHSAVWITNTSGNNFQITGNTIGYASSTGTGTYTFVGLASTLFIPIYINVGTTTATNVSTNTIAGISISGALSGTTSSAPFRGIYILAGVTTTNSNVIGSQSATASISYSSSATTASDFIGIMNFGSSAWTSNSNTVGGINVANSSTGASNFYGLSAPSTVTSWTCNSNTIGGSVSNSINNTSSATGTINVGISSVAPTFSCTGNIIRNITSAGGTGIIQSSSISGIASSAGTSGTLSQNQIYNLTNSNTGSSAVSINGVFCYGAGTNLVERNLVYNISAATTVASNIYGIYAYGGTSTYQNNMISLGNNSGGSSITGNHLIAGLYVGGGTNNFYHNSSYIGGIGVTTGSALTYAYYSVSTSTRNIKNNIFFNARSNSTGTGTHVGLFENSSTGLSLANNDYFANGTGGAITRLSTTNYTSLATWQAAVSDAASISADPNFIAPASATPNLHINTSTGAAVDGTGVSIATVTNDYDNDTRSSFSPTDIGADAYILLATPVISSLSASSGCDGSSFVINGTYLGATTSVTIGGVAVSSIVSNTSTAITVIPANGSTGTVTVTTPGGSVTSSVSYTSNPVPTTPTVTGGGSVCGSTTLTASNGNSGTMYWQNTTSNGTSTATPSSSQSVSASGTYYFNAQSAAGCWSASASAVVTISTAISITTQPSSSAQNKCVNAAATALTVAASGTGPSYQWFSNSSNSNSGGTLISGSTGTSFTPPTLAGNVGTTYYYCVVSSGAPCNSSVASGVSGAINVYALPTISGSTTACTGQTTQLTGSVAANATNPWVSATTSVATINSSGLLSGIASGSSIITFTDVNGCVATRTQTVSVTPTAITITPPAAFCSGGVATLAASGGVPTPFNDLMNVLSPNFTTSTVGTGTPTATLNSTYFSEGTGSILFNTTSTSANVAYSLNSNVNLSGFATAQLTFAHIAAMEGPTTTFDVGYVEYSTDGGATWTAFPASSYAGAGTLVGTGSVGFSTKSYASWISAFTGTGSLPNNTLWKSETYNIPVAALTSQFRVRFRYTTDSSSNYYGWLIDNVKIAGTIPTITWTPTTNLYTDLAATSAYAGSTTSTVYAKLTSGATYTASSTYGSCTASTNITVTPNPLPNVSTAGSTLCSNGIGFNMSASGASSYSWSPSTGLSATTGATVTANPSSTTTYTVTGTDANGCVNSVTAIVTVNNAVVITSQPSSVVALVNDNVSFTVAATGTGLTYQWQVNDGTGYVNISGETNATLSLTAVTSGMNGYSYQCIVSGTSPCGPVTSSAATLTISSIAISSQPSNQTICSTGTATFTIATTGGAATYQWQVSTNSGVSWTDLSGETGTSLTVSSVTSTNSGTQYRCSINTGAIYSNAATLTVYDAVAITSQPVSTVTCSNSANVSFSVTATGSNLTYQWQVSTNGGSTWSNVSGATSATYTINTPAVSLNQNQYQVIVSGSSPCGAVTSSAATLTVTDLSVSTLSASVCLGMNLSFTATPSAGASSFTYSWTSTSGSGATTAITTNPAVITPTAVGTYTYTLAATSGSCTFSITRNATVINPNATVTATASATPSVMCAGASTSLAMNISSPGTATVGAGATTSSDYPNPFYSNWSNTEQQILVKASELSAAGLTAGNITALQLNITSGTTIMPNFTLSMQHTTATALSTLAAAAGFTQVYTNTTGITPVIGLNTITFSTPFTWDGTSNLLLKFCWGNSGSTATINSTCTADNTSYVCSVNAHNTTGTSGSTICSSTSVYLTYSVRPKFFFIGNTAATATAYSWSDGSSVIGTTNPLTYTPSASGTFTGTATVNGCPLTASTSVTVNPLPTAPTVSNSTQCGSGIPTCSATGGSAGQYRWYTASSGGTAIAGETNGTLSTYSVSASTTLYVSINNGTCESARVAVSITVTPPPTFTVVTDLATVCNNAVATLSVSSTVGDYTNYAWTPTTNLYTDAAATTAYTSGSASTIYFKTATAGSYTLTANASNSGTGCSNTATVTVFVQPASATVSSSANNLCLSGSATLSATPATGYATGSLQWQSSADNITFADVSGATAVTLATGTISATTYYKFLVKNSAGSTCLAPSVTVTVNNPTITGTTPATRCGTGTATLQATANAGSTINWYAASTGGTSLGTGTSYNTPSISATTTYYVDASVLGSPITGGRLAPTSTSNVTPSTYGLVFNANTDMVLNSVDVYNGGAAGTVTVQLQNSLGTVLQTSSAFNLPAGTGTTATTLSLGWTVPAGTGYRLLATTGTASMVRETSLGGFPYAVGSVASITNGYFAGTTTTYYYFYNWNVSGMCTSARTAVAATVNAAPALTFATSSTTICNGSSSSALTLSSTASDYDTYTWTPSASVTGNSSSGWVFNPTTATTYTLNASQSTGGLCVNSTTYTVNVNPIPSALTITPSSPAICVGGSIGMNVSGGTITSTGTFGTGTAVNTTSSYPGVYSSYFGGQKSQILLLASELTAAGFTAGTPLTSIGFPVSSLGTGWGTTITSLQNFQISMGHTALGALTGFVTGLTQVRTPYAYTPVVGTASANTHTFTTNFTWNGTSNVVIEIAFSNNTLGTVAMAVIQPYSTTAFNSFLNYRADNTAIAGILSATTISNGPNTSRPNFTLNGTVLPTYSWSPSTGLNTTSGASVTANPTTTTTYTATATAPNTCTNSAQVTVTVNPLPTPTFTASAGATTCLNTPTTYTTQSGMTNYVWTFSGTAGTDYTIVSGGTSSSNTVSITWLTQGSKTVTVGYTNGNGCVYATAASNTTTVDGIDWANMQFPASSAVCQGSNITAYGQVYEPGVTPGAGSQGAGITVQLGMSSVNTNPNTWAAGVWTNANFNALGGGVNNDEYMLDFGASLSPGTYYYTFRYSLNGCAYQYGGYSVSGGGFWDGVNYVSGVLTVNPTYSPSVAVTASATTVCTGTSVTFTATPTSGGSSPSYQWYLNGNPVGTGSTTYTNSSLVDGDVVHVVMTANNTCQTASTVSSSNVAITVTPLNTYYADNDQDGYGDASSSTTACSAPTGYVANSTDCDDTDSSINPAATEVCNGIDDNCNSSIDDGLSFTTYFVDADGDGYGSTSSSSFCANPGAGYSLVNTDCDDAASAVNPGASEVCNSIDDDCNGLTDDGITYTNYYLDQDGDGFGAGTAVSFCSNPGSSYSLLNTDCNDGNAFINPSASEVCNNIDDNCNSSIDEGVQTTFYADVDNDGFGNAGSTTLACTAPTGYVSTSTDCNDANASINPNTIWYHDADGDGYYGSTTASCTSPGSGYSLNSTVLDCNDANAAVSPIATEVCNGVDDNCDGLIDNNTGNTYYADVDNDGYGNASSTTLACTQPAGYVSNSTDCNDANALVNPGVTELCNFIDDNCNGTIDEGCNTTVPGEEPGNALIAPGTYFPTCMNFYGTLQGAIPSIYAQSYCLTGEDVWYTFNALSTAATIYIGTYVNDIVIELQDANGNLIDVENSVSGLGTEIMNVSGLTLGATYRVGVRNFNSGVAAGGMFSACIRYFKKGNCDSGGGGPWPNNSNRCSMFKATYAGASAGVQYRFTFTGTSGEANGNVYTRTQNSDYLVLTNLTPTVPSGCNYSVLVTNIYTIQDGAGNNEVIEVSANSPCVFTVTSDPLATLRLSDQCSNGPRWRGSIVASLPWICGVTNWRWRFTEVNPLTYAVVGIPIEVNRNAASNYLNIGTVSQLQYGKTYAVQSAPILSYTSTNYVWGPVSYMCIIGTAGMVIDNEGHVQNDDAPKSFIVNEPSMSVYPNPTQDGETNLYISGLNDERVTVRCFDAMGKMVYHNTSFVAYGNQSVVSLPGEMSNGVYLVRVDGTEFHRSLRYVIEK